MRPSSVKILSKESLHIDTSKLDDIVLHQKRGHLEEQTVAFVTMINEFDRIFVLVDFFDLQDKIDFVGNVALLYGLFLISWFSERSPPGNELQTMGLEEGETPISQLFNSVPLEVSEFSVYVLLDLSVAGGLEGGAFAALVDEPVGVHVQVADQLAAVVDHELGHPPLR